MLAAPATDADDAADAGSLSRDRSRPTSPPLSIHAAAGSGPSRSSRKSVSSGRWRMLDIIPLLTRDKDPRLNHACAPSRALLSLFTIRRRTGADLLSERQRGLVTREEHARHRRCEKDPDMMFEVLTARGILNGESDLPQRRSSMIVRVQHSRRLTSCAVRAVHGLR